MRSWSRSRTPIAWSSFRIVQIHVNWIELKWNRENRHNKSYRKLHTFLNHTVTLPRNIQHKRNETGQSALSTQLSGHFQLRSSGVQLKSSAVILIAGAMRANLPDLTLGIATKRNTRVALCGVPWTRVGTSDIKRSLLYGYELRTIYSACLAVRGELAHLPKQGDDFGSTAQPRCRLSALKWMKSAPKFRSLQEKLPRAGCLEQFQMRNRGS